MLNFRWSNLDDLEFLVELRIRDLEMFSDLTISLQMISKIRDFYQTGIINNTCFTLLGFKDELLVASGTLYLYLIMPSNENPSGVMGQLTNVWVVDKYRNRGIATRIINELLDIAKDKCGMVCLNSSDEAISLYYKLGFGDNKRYLIKRWDNKDNFK